MESSASFFGCCLYYLKKDAFAGNALNGGLAQPSRCAAFPPEDE